MGSVQPVCGLWFDWWFNYICSCYRGHFSQLSGLGDARKLVEHKRNEAWYFWCLGAALFSNLVAFFGMSYFDQMQFAWYPASNNLCFSL